MSSNYWKWIDPGHLEAHQKDFLLSPDHIMRMLEPLISPGSHSEDRIPLYRDWYMDEVTGYSGLRECSSGDDSFWAYRKGRSIPSHLIHGEKEETHWICLAGFWKERRFFIHTLYPGRKAPREIHDPSLSPEELKEAVEFWSVHAIIVKEGDYSWEPS